MQRSDPTNDRNGSPRTGGRQLRAQAAVDGVRNDEESLRPDAVEPAPDPRATTIWRSRLRRDIDPGSIDAIRAILAGPLGIHDRRWRAAVGGDAAAAVAIAIRFLHHHDNGTAARDLVMSNLLVHALDGDPAAAAVLAHALVILSRDRPDAVELVTLSAQWARRPAPDRTTGTEGRQER